MNEPLEPQIQSLWNVRDLAAFLRTTPAAIYPLVQRNGIPHLKVGRNLRFDPAAIRRWLTSRSSGTWSRLLMTSWTSLPASSNF